MFENRIKIATVFVVITVMVIVAAWFYTTSPAILPTANKNTSSTTTVFTTKVNQMLNNVSQSFGSYSRINATYNITETSGSPINYTQHYMVYYLRYGNYSSIRVSGAISSGTIFKVNDSYYFCYSMNGSSTCSTMLGNGGTNITEIFNYDLGFIDLNNVQILIPYYSLGNSSSTDPLPYGYVTLIGNGHSTPMGNLTYLNYSGININESTYSGQKCNTVNSRMSTTSFLV